MLRRLLHYSEICFVMGFLGVAEVGARSTMFELVVNILKRGMQFAVLDVFTRNLSSPQMRSRVPKSKISSYRINSPPTDAAA